MSQLHDYAKKLYGNPTARSISQAVRRARRRFDSRRLPHYNSINTFESRVLSEMGEDGILHEIFFRLGSGTKTLVEFGAADGKESTGALLAQFYKWSGLLIDGGSDEVASLRRIYSGRSDITIYQEMITRENIASLFRRAGVPKEFDFLSIDIDGNDYWVWGALSEWRPRVVSIEYNATLDPSAFWTIAYNASHVWGRDRYFGASLAAQTYRGSKLGYALVGTARGGRNAFFIRRDLLAESQFDELAPAQASHPATDFVRLLPFPQLPAVTSAQEADAFEAAHPLL